MNTKYATQQKPEGLEFFSAPNGAIIIFKSTTCALWGGNVAEIGECNHQNRVLTLGK